MARVGTVSMCASWVAVPPTWSVTSRVKFQVPITSGVPEITPVVGSRVKPGGSEPSASDQVNVPVPPDAVMPAENGVPTAEPGSRGPPIVGAAATVTDSDWVATAPAPSVTWSVKVDVPAAVGVPVISPVEGSTARPAGRVPPVTDHVGLPVPPVTVGVWS